MPLVLSACGGTPLREDIAQFIGKFSLLRARENVKHGSYLSETISVDKDGKESHELIENSFSIQENKEVSYFYSVIRRVGEEETSFTKSIETVSEKYILTANGVKSEITYDEACIHTRDFFYTKYNSSTNYCFGAMYYGDIIIESAAKQQNFVTIDQQKQTYTYLVPGLIDGNIFMKINYIVNTYGMLTYLKDELYDKNNREIKAITTITTTY